MNFLEELEWRGMVHQLTPGVEKALAEGRLIGYIGFDPTAPSMTIGNYVQIMLLSLFQRSGHQPIVLMGGATGRIGDPSGKDRERELKTYEELDKNLEAQVLQARKFLDFNSEDNPAILLNNLDFYKDMNVLDFLRDVGKTLTINYMMGKESVKKRIETGISFTEFAYQLLQAYDFQCLYNNYNCVIQMGGSDQWGNITSGTEFIRRNLEGKAFAITTPLLTKADGQKFGKSEDGNLWLSADLTSPYKFYQFWINADDADIPKFIRYFTFRSKEEVLSLENEFANDPQTLKRLLAEELTIRVHSEADYQSVLKVSELLFDRHANKATLVSLDAAALKTVAEEIDSFPISKADLQNGISVAGLLAEQTAIVSSKAEARRAIQGNAISINKDKISDYEAIINSSALLHDRYIMIENGKKNKFMLIVE